MSCRVDFHAQLVAVMEELSRAAVDQICKLVDDGNCVLRLEAMRHRRENETLRQKLRAVERELKAIHTCTQPRDTGVPEPWPSFANGGPEDQDEDTLLLTLAMSDACADVEEDTGPDLVFVKEERAGEVTGRKHLENVQDGEGVADLHADQESIDQQQQWKRGQRADHFAAGSDEAGNARFSTSSQTGFLHPKSEFVSFKEESEMESVWNEEQISAINYNQETASFLQRNLTGDVDDSTTAHHCRFDAPLPTDSHSQGFLMPAEVNKRPFGCSHCNKTFSRKDHLKVHQRVHTGEKPYVCVECGKRFAQFSGLVHHRTVHTKAKLFVCTLCGKNFAQKCSLRLHQRIHTGEKPHICLWCGKRFSQRFTLKVHQRTHTGERPFACATCGKTFTNSNVLKNHQRTHSGERPFSCVVCGKSFTQNNSLKKHMQIHTKDNVQA